MWRAVNNRSSRTCLNLNDYQFKASRYSHGSTYMNSIITTNQKHIIDSQKPKVREHKHDTKEKDKKKQEQRKT